jgi:hypothetical protein
MGMVFGEVTFDRRGPTIEELAAKITDVCGLPVTIEPPGHGDLNIYDQHAHLAFAASPEEKLEVFSYLPGAARKFYNEHLEGFTDLPIAKHAVGLEPEGTQVVHLRSFLGYEPTLMAVAVLALESLGGRPREPIGDEYRREFAQKITEKQLAERREILHGQLKRAAWIQVLLLPITIPLIVLNLVLTFARMPWILWKARQEYEKIEDRQKHKKFMLSIGTHYEFLPTTPDDYPDLDRSALRYYTQAFEALGFVHALDYRVESDVRVGTGFARLFFHPQHLCLVEINQVFSKKRGPHEMRCMIGSILEDGWSLSTTDRTLSPLTYVWRRPRSLWSTHTHKKPAELLEEHLRRRSQLIERTRVAVKSIQTADAYFEYEQQIHAARREVLQSKTYAAIKAEMEQCKKAPISEWLGELA